MDRTPISDKKDQCRRIDHQVPHKLKEGRFRHLALGQYETQLTLRTHCSEHVDVEAGAGKEHNGRVTVRHPKKDLPIGTARAIAKLAGLK